MKHNNVGKVGQAVANGGSEANGSSERHAECGNCRGLWKVGELRGFRDFWSRVEPGEEIPAGDCPECGAFAYLVKKSAEAKNLNAELLEALRDIKALASYPNGGIENADVSDMQEDLEAIKETAEAAIAGAKKRGNTK